jgi:putative RecB family exonuclease
MIALIEKPTETAPKSDILEVASASRVKSYLSCSLRYYFEYVLGLKGPASPALTTGKAIHHCLQTWSLLRWRKLPAEAENIRASFDSYWDNPEEEVTFESEEAESKEKEKAWNTFLAFLQLTEIPKDERPDAVEVWVEKDLRNHGLPFVLRGVLDLVRPGPKADGKNSVLVDFKSSAASVDDRTLRHRHLFQMGCYAMLYREATQSKESALEIHSLIKTKQSKYTVTRSGPMTQDQETRVFKTLEHYAEGVASERFIPNPGMHCSGCPHMTRCEAWNGGAA